MAAAFSGALDPSFAQAKIDAKSLQHALDDKSGRYVIRLPKPEAYVAAKRFRSRVGATYVPEAATEQNYATQVSFRYTVSTLNGFSLAGTPDTGTFNPLLLQLETPAIRFAIEPAVPDSPTDMCHTHSREAFRDTVKFLGLTLYVDFPNDPADCHKTDLQVPHSTKAEAVQDRRGSNGWPRFCVETLPACRRQAQLAPLCPTIQGSCYRGESWEYGERSDGCGVFVPRGGRGLHGADPVPHDYRLKQFPEFEAEMNKLFSASSVL